MAHTCYRVADLKESVKFYIEAFDFEVSRERDFPEYKFTLVYLTLPGSNYELELTYNYDHGAYELGDGYGHIAISVEDLEALYENIRRLDTMLQTLKVYRDSRQVTTSLKIQMDIKLK